MRVFGKLPRIINGNKVRRRLGWPNRKFFFVPIPTGARDLDLLNFHAAVSELMPSCWTGVDNTGSAALAKTDNDRIML